MIVDFEKRNFGLDVMRTIAITLVLVIHLIVNFFSFDPGLFWYLAYLGVDIFFVLSGFLIGQLLINSIDSSGRFTFFGLRRFLVRRWMRTVPLYYFILLLNFVIAYTCYHSINNFDFRYIFWLQNLIGVPPSFFGESWSLSIEEWFYLMFPLGMLFCLRISKGKKHALNLLIYTLLFIITGNCLRLAYGQEGYNEFIVVICRLDVIAYGVLFAVLESFYCKGFFKREYKNCGLAGFVILSTGIFSFLGRKWTGGYYILYYPLAGVGLSFILIYLKRIRYITGIPAADRFFHTWSKLSYSIYLNNLLIIYLIKYYLPWPAFSQAVLALIGTLIMSKLTYHLIEKKFIALRESYFPSIKKNYAPSSLRHKAKPTVLPS